MNRSTSMIPRFLLAATASIALLATPTIAQTSGGSAGKTMSGADLLKKLNTDGDDTFEMPEVMSLAEGVFREINPDGDETLEPDETKGRLAAGDFPKQDFPNNQQASGDKTVDLYQWLTIAREDFKTADTNKDGKIDAEELDSDSGARLLAMITPAT